MHRHYLPTPLRRTLEKTIKQARIVAEEGAGDAIRRLGVAEAKSPAYLAEAERGLRRRLRAHARALGDRFDRDTETVATRKLVEAAAYAHWHRMLFARFLAERGLLRHPEHGVAVTLDDCRELAAEEGLADAWAAAERYAALMLPGVFRIDDPVLELDLDPAHNQALMRLVTDLNPDVFQAEDSLGWTYQFWRAAEKAAINDSGVKIGADELPAVTQLFTEPYMVQFLLHNTLGAWWAGKVLAADPRLAQTASDEDVLRAACSLSDYSFDMLRFVREGEDGPWRPAAGTFPGWPNEADAITMLDPCCGSGHFLTEALAILAALRQAEEQLSPTDAVAAVLRNNLYGLEIDGRCVQIAAFAVALSAWRIGGWQTLPVPHIAWVGAPPPLPKKEFVALGDGNAELKYALAALHDLFAKASSLGSLLEPSGGDLFEAERMFQIERLLSPLLERARKAEPEHAEGVIAARGMSDALTLLLRRFTLQATNVPFLSAGKMAASLSTNLKIKFEIAKGDLATAMLLRMSRLASQSGTVAAVSPQNWYELDSYRRIRQYLLQNSILNFASDLGSGAFHDMNFWVARTTLTILSIGGLPDEKSTFSTVCADLDKLPSAKHRQLQRSPISTISKQTVLDFPSNKFLMKYEEPQELLSFYGNFHNGICSGDYSRFGRWFWEIWKKEDKWIFQQSTTLETGDYCGCHYVLLWEKGQGALLHFVVERLGEQNVASWIRGQDVWGSPGVIISPTGRIRASLYAGYSFDNNSIVLTTRDPDDLRALWCYVSSGGYSTQVRMISKALKVQGDLIRVPFDRQRYLELANELLPNGLPEPSSNDATQWLFHGHPASIDREKALHVAFARLCGYRWPAETDNDMCLSAEARAWIAKAGELPPSDNDGLLGVPALAGEKPLAERLRAYLTAAFGSDWSDALERRLVAESDDALDKKAARDGSLEAWVRDRAFRQHCTLFGQRPFLWHISDGLKDGFSVFVHYHRFDQANLRKLTYTLLGDWLRRAKDENNALRYEKGRELQQMLEKILEGEKPYDIFVRWKPLAAQPLGWEPDLDDGVRMNIRPFVEAGILRDTPRIKWTKDRGTDVKSAPWYHLFKGERINDHHTTLAEKRAAREAAQKRLEAAK